MATGNAQFTLAMDAAPTLAQMREIGDALKGALNQHFQLQHQAPACAPSTNFVRRFVGNAHQRRVQRRAFAFVRDALAFPSES